MGSSYPIVTMSRCLSLGLLLLLQIFSVGATDNQCSRGTICRECLSIPGCSWCSQPGNVTQPRCSLEEDNRERCREEFLEVRGTSYIEKLWDGPTPRNNWDWEAQQLRPQHYRISNLAVGNTQTFNFTFLFISSGVTLTHNFPPEIEVQFSSNCGGSNRCSGMYNGSKGKFSVDITLKTCPANSRNWKNKFNVFLSSHKHNITVDLTTRCFCGCDSFSNPTGAECSEDSLDYLSVNPCSIHDTCGNCLQTPSCSWCAHPDYTFFDGSMLPRCNNDTFFASSLCPVEGVMDPPTALEGHCEYCTCEQAGGLCHQDRQDLIEGNQCPSQQTCSSCTQYEDCQWCNYPVPGQSQCSHVNTGAQCLQGEPLQRTTTTNTTTTTTVNIDICDCDNRCNVGFKSYKKFSTEYCERGDFICGACSCPEGYTGSRCECEAGMLAPVETVTLPVLEAGKATNITSYLQPDCGPNDWSCLTMSVSIGAVGCTDCRVECNQNRTRCTNPTTSECVSHSSREPVDRWRKNNFMVIYGSHRILPGAKFTVRFTYCSEDDSAEYAAKHTLVGVGVPPVNITEYVSPRDRSPSWLAKYWTSEAYWWELGTVLGWAGSSPGSTWYRYSHWGDKYGTWDFSSADTPSGAHYPRVKHKRTGNISFEATHTEIIWRMEEFKDESNEGAGLKDYRHALDVMEKEFYPVFGFGGCNNPEIPSVEIVSSTGLGI